jgi:molybdopterin synthase sulfur carrier subunit
MAVTVKLPTQLRAAAGGQSRLEADGATVGAVLQSVYGEHPELKDSISDADGGLRRFVNVYVDGEDVRFGDGLDTPVKDGGEVQILPAVAGGC